jgi:uncharacterized protein (TIGR00369 family)
MVSPETRQAIMDRITRIPIFETLEMRVDAMDDGYFEVTIPRRKRYDGIFDSLHGGLLTTLADSVAAYAILTLAGPDEPMTTTDLSIRFLAPCLTSVTAKGRVIKFGRTLCPVAVDLFDENGKQVAAASVSYMRLGRKDPSA